MGIKGYKMKICVYADPHWSQYSSILRSRGKKYSTRLEGLIDTMNWVEEISEEHGCDAILCLGDFFDKPSLNAEEITALKEVHWNKSINHYFLVGNHEMGSNDLIFNSTNVLDFTVFDTPYKKDYDDMETQICVLPYILERNRDTIQDYFGDTQYRRIIFSHNDVKGIQLGLVESQTGFELSDIRNNCDYFINGHIHNAGTLFSDSTNYFNLGNISGQNFSEDATRYRHCALIIDITKEGISMDFYENPDAFNFYKLIEDEYTYIEYRNAVVSLKISESKVEKARKYLSDKTIELRILTEYEHEESSEEYEEKIESSDYLNKFVQYVFSNIGNNELISDELMKVIG